MGINNVMQTGRSGMMASKTSIATSGHNITNANTEGYSRQRVLQSNGDPVDARGKGVIGTGVKVDRIERINDSYLEKQLRNGSRSLAHSEEKDQALRQIEDIFNEMNGDGLNRMMSRFFNEFRKLANDPGSEAVRQSVRESTQSLVGDFKRIRKQVDEVRHLIDNRIEGYSREANRHIQEIRDLNLEIARLELKGGPANDLLDKRDMALKNLAEIMDISTHTDNEGKVTVELKGIGPIVSGPVAEKFLVERSPGEAGKPSGSFDLKTTASASASVTDTLKGGKLGALLEVRDQTLSGVMDRLDELAFELASTVNQVHRQGFTRDGGTGVDFFKQPLEKNRASEFLELSDAVKANSNNIAAAAQLDARGDNRIALAIASIQGVQLMNGGHATMDDFYNSIVSDIGVVVQRNRAELSQNRDILTQLEKMREQISGVSIDEETTNLLQAQQVFDASAKVISIADEMLNTVLSLRP